jgi:hypothetical protein
MYDMVDLTYTAISLPVPQREQSVLCDAEDGQLLDLRRNAMLLHATTSVDGFVNVSRNIEALLLYESVLLL